MSCVDANRVTFVSFMLVGEAKLVEIYQATIGM